MRLVGGKMMNWLCIFIIFGTFFCIITIRNDFDDAIQKGHINHHNTIEIALQLLVFSNIVPMLIWYIAILVTDTVIGGVTVCVELLGMLV